MRVDRKNMRNYLQESNLRRSFVVLDSTNCVRIDDINTLYWRRSDTRTSVRGVQQPFGTASFFCSRPNEHNNINEMLDPVNHANEAKNSNLDRTNRAPKWVGTIGFLLLLCAPIDDISPNFERNAIFYLLFNVPCALLCFYFTGGLDEFINYLKNRK